MYQYEKSVRQLKTILIREIESVHQNQNLTIDEKTTRILEQVSHHLIQLNRIVASEPLTTLRVIVGEHLQSLPERLAESCANCDGNIKLLVDYEVKLLSSTLEIFQSPLKRPFSNLTNLMLDVSDELKSVVRYLLNINLLNRMTQGLIDSVNRDLFSREKLEAASLANALNAPKVQQIEKELRQTDHVQERN
jgi:hypothetical protein